jgi:putative ABC transport system permease protein
MNFLEPVRVALEMLVQNKLRAFLTMLGVIIGVMSVTMIVIITNAFQAYMNAQFAEIGANTIFVFYDPFTRMHRGQHVGPDDSLKLEDIDYILSHTKNVELGSGLKGAGSQTVRYGDKDLKSVETNAIDENFAQLMNMEILEGRQISKQDNDNKANVCVISEDVRNQLFPKGDALGKVVLLNGITLEVVGVAAKPKGSFGQDNPKSLTLPLSTAHKKWLGGKNVDMILLKRKPGVKMDVVLQEIWVALMAKSGNRPVYRVDSNESILAVFEGVIGVAGMVLACVAALALLVGGIGIMNIMLVSVTERTREIGLRKAVGAKKSAILLQFLVEAGMLSLVGGLIGMFIAWMLGNIVTIMTIMRGWPNKDGLATPFPFFAAILAAAFSALIGMVFGLYPAVNAAKLDPIVALRHE